MSLIERTVGAAKNARNTVTRAVRDPQVLREEARDLPLRAFQFAVRGFGQALVITDRLRGRDRSRPGRSQPADTARAGDERPADEPVTAEPDAAARTIRPATEAPATPTAEQKQPEAKKPEAKKSATKPAAKPADKPTAKQKPKPAGTAKPAPAEPTAELPVPDYDSRTVPSLRARLRGLSTADVKRLLEYEQTHADRAEVVAMYERRIAKLATEGEH